MGLFSVQYFMDPTDPAWKDDRAVNDYFAIMKKYDPEGSITDVNTIFGYTVARSLEGVLKQAGDNLTRANIMKQAASLHGQTLDTLLPGIKITTSATDYAPIEQVQLEQFDGKEYKRFGQLLGKEE